MHAYRDTRGRNLCDRCNEWLGSPRHNVDADVEVLRGLLTSARRSGQVTIGVDADRLERVVARLMVAH